MKYRIIIEQLTPPEAQKAEGTVGPLEVFRQVVEDLDLGTLITEINRKPRGRPAKRKEPAT